MVKQWALAIILGIILGAITFFSRGTIFILTLFLIIGYSIYRFARPEEKFFLASMFVIGFLIRVFAVLLQDGAALIFFPDSSMYKVENPELKNDDYTNLIREKTRVYFKIGDSDYASARGYMYAAYVRGEDNIVVRHYLGSIGRVYGWHGYLYVIGCFYYLFDYSPISVKFINCLLGALTATFIYLLTVNFTLSGAKIAHCLATFFPTMILWSTTHLKDTSISFLAVILVFAMLKFLMTRKLKYSLSLISVIFVQSFLIKKDLWFLSIAFVILSYLIFVFIGSKRRLLWLLNGMGLLFLILVSYGPKVNSFVSQTIYKLLVIHHGHVGTRGISYKILDPVYYATPDLLYNIPFFIFLKFLFRGVYHFILEPLPFRFFNLSFLYVMPQMVFWYFLLPFMFIGIIISLGRNKVGALIIMGYLVLSTVSIALSSGNIGTLVRHRDYVSQFYLIFAAIGLSFLDKVSKEKSV